MVADGDNAPDFDLPANGGARCRLSDFRGHPVVVYFYPKDDTSGCTKEAVGFTELSDAFAEKGAKIVGISPDSPDKHDKFIAKHNLKLQLASDEDHSVSEAYGVWAEKSMYGKKYMGIERSTFLIDRDGKIAKSWRKVKVPGHAESVLEAVRGL